MYLQYGSFPFQTGEAMPVFYGERRKYNSRGRAQTKVKRLVVRGEIVADGEDAINARIGAIQNELLFENQTVVFKKTDGSDTHIKLDTTAISGVRILDANFDAQPDKAHFATGHPFSIVFEGEYLLSDFDPYVSYEESVTQVGNGGAAFVVQELDSGLPIMQTTRTNTAVRIIQSGRAVGAVDYPNFPGPWFPEYLQNPDHTVTTQHPRQAGLTWVDWPISWSYRMLLPSTPGFLVTPGLVV